jgi:hypothetical protein
MYERLTRREAGGASTGAGRSAHRGPGSSPSPSRPTFDELGDRLLAAAVPAAIRGLNRLGLGPFDPDLSGRALRRAGLKALAEVVRRLEIDAEHVVFGHTHRPGPLAHDVEGWELPSGTRLLNTGSWVYDPTFLGVRPSDSPYWPGRCVVVEEGRAPDLLHPLADAGHEELARTE